MENLSRRNLITAGGVAAAALALPGSALAGLGKKKSMFLNDFDILNFALNLEYLEAEFYSYAVYGTGIDASLFGGDGTQGPTTGGRKVKFGDAKLEALAKEVAFDELSHVKFLRQGIVAFGGTPVAKPAINLNALNVGFDGPAGFLTLARAFEDTGVSAYGGAAKLISDPQILEYAGQILAAEAYHAGIFRYLLAKPTPGFATDGKDQPPTTSNLIPTDSNGLAVIRTAAEVAAIVRGPSASGGVFFPNGLNGTIK